jgi:DNA-binding NarL/FixJ family response regulator
MNTKVKTLSGDLSNKKMKMMIVDDSVLIRERIVSMFKDNNQIEIIGEAENSNEAMSIFSEFAPEIVILDIRLPGENGIEVLNKIKKEAETTIVIILTNFPYSQYRIKCEESGADYFLDKSNAFDTIESIFREIIENNRKVLKS